MIQKANKIFRRQSFFLIASVFFLFSCGEEQTSKQSEQAYPVEITVLKSSKKVQQIEYFGIVSSSIINYSFLTAGRVKNIFVHKNQYVTKGTKLIQLETNGYNLALNAAVNQVNQAKTTYDEAENYYQKLESASNTGGISETDLKKAKLDRDIKFKDWEQSKINQQAKNDDFKQATLTAQSNGIVSDIIPKIGELINAGSETIIIQGKGMFAETALSQKDMDYVKSGTIAVVEIKNQKLKGKVTHISSLPDMQTFRHTVKIDFSQNEIKNNITIGQTAKIFFETDTVSGFWLPVNYISNDGNDFVNVVENKRMRKKKIQILDFSGDMVRVSGLKENEKLITKGGSKIKEGYKVVVKN